MRLSVSYLTMDGEIVSETRDGVAADLRLDGAVSLGSGRATTFAEAASRPFQYPAGLGDEVARCENAGRLSRPAYQRWRGPISPIVLAAIPWWHVEPLVIPGGADGWPAWAEPNLPEEFE